MTATPERRLKRQRRRAQHAGRIPTADELMRLRFAHGIVTRAELEAEIDGIGVFGVPPTPEAISNPTYAGHVQAGNEAAAGILAVKGAVGYDVYVGRHPGW